MRALHEGSVRSRVQTTSCVTLRRVAVPALAMASIARCLSHHPIAAVTLMTIGARVPGGAVLPCITGVHACALRAEMAIHKDGHLLTHHTRRLRKTVVKLTHSIRAGLVDVLVKTVPSKVAGTLPTMRLGSLVCLVAGLAEVHGQPLFGTARTPRVHVHARAPVDVAQTGTAAEIQRSRWMRSLLCLIARLAEVQIVTLRCATRTPRVRMELLATNGVAQPCILADVDRRSRWIRKEAI